MANISFDISPDHQRQQRKRNFHASKQTSLPPERSLYLMTRILTVQISFDKHATTLKIFVQRVKLRLGLSQASIVRKSRGHRSDSTMANHIRCAGRSVCAAEWSDIFGLSRATGEIDRVIIRYRRFVELADRVPRIFIYLRSSNTVHLERILCLFPRTKAAR